MITTLDLGGAEMMLCKLVADPRGLSALDPIVIWLAGPGKLAKQFRDAGIQVFSIGMHKHITDVGRFFRLVKILRSLRPHLIQTWLYHADLMGLAAGRLFTDARVIWNVRCAYMDLAQYPLATKLCFHILAKLSAIPHGIIFNSIAGQRFHAQSGYDTSKAVLIPNGFDTTLYKPDAQARSLSRRQWGIGEDEPVVGLVARFDPMKDHHTFFNAAQRLIQSMPLVKFLLVGNGLVRLNADLWEMIRKNGLENSVLLLGEQRNLQDIYPCFDILTLTSTGEGFPNVLGEAMACEVPCVATDAGDAGHIIKDTGITTPLRDAEALARAWKHLLSMPPAARKELGAAARRRIENHFSLSRVREQYVSYYQRFFESN